jgi:hypothetical protein
MSFKPKTVVGQIEACEQRVTPFTDNAVAIGSSAPVVAAFVAKTEAARAAYTVQRDAVNAAKNATIDLHVAMNAMWDSMSEIFKQVVAKAASAGDGVYALASLPVPKIPGPAGEPGKPNQFKATLMENGALELSWKCTNPAAGTVYQVWRRIGGTGEFTYCGGCGTKSYLDATIPAGSSQVTYQIQGVRSTAAGEWAQFNVNFGVSTAGAMTTSVTETAALPKMAA